MKLITLIALAKKWSIVRSSTVASCWRKMGSRWSCRFLHEHGIASCGDMGRDLKVEMYDS